MHKLNLNCDDNSIDFDFFESERGKFTRYENKKNDSSRIITKAVIEAKPKNHPETNETRRPLKTLKLGRPTATVINENLIQNMIDDCVSSPSSTEEKRLIDNPIEDITLFNCLAFDDGNDRQIFNMDDKYSSDNSLSDSTITTVTSDFTSVSHMSSMSDSSCGSDLSTDSSMQTPELLVCDNVENVENLDIDQSEKHLIMTDESSSSENLSHEADSESENHENHSGNHADNQNQETNFPVDKDDSNSINSDTSSRNIESDNTGDLYEKETSCLNHDHIRDSRLSRKESISTIEERLGDISLASQSNSSNSSMAKPHYFRGLNKIRSKKRDLNLTFSREELFRIERDNTILLKKIMAYSKPRTVSLNHAFSHKKTSAAINRARQQKKIEQDNYILYSKINAMSRMKKVY